MANKEEKKIKWYQKLGTNLFAKFFGFEEGVDITDDIAVLHRRNVVIKNIILLSNTFYTILLFITTLTTQATIDWVVSFVAIPITYLVNKLLKSLIFADPRDKTKQEIAMYVASLYIFSSSILIYFKLIDNESLKLEALSYVLIYYSLVVISLYQYRSLLKNAFSYLFVLVSLIHLINPIKLAILSEEVQKPIQFFGWFAKSDAFGQFILRSLIFGLYYLILYVIISIGQYMQEERKKELTKRRQVQDDFAIIVGDLFNAVFVNAYIAVDEDAANNVAKLTKKLANLMGYNKVQINNLVNFSLIHLKFEEIKDYRLGQTHDDRVYEELKEKSTLGADILKRMELLQNVDSIIRALGANHLDADKLTKIIDTHSDLNSQIILLAEVYYSLRRASPYKRPHPYSQTLDIIKTHIEPFFDEELMQRFTKFSHEVEQVYNTLK